jgi:hypothetical protein
VERTVPGYTVPRKKGEKSGHPLYCHQISGCPPLLLHVGVGVGIGVEKDKFLLEVTIIGADPDFDTDSEYRARV